MRYGSLRLWGLTHDSIRSTKLHPPLLSALLPKQSVTTTLASHPAPNSYPKHLVQAQEPSNPRQVRSVAVGSIDGASAAWGLLGDGSGSATERLNLQVLIRAVGCSCLVVGVAHRIDGAWVHEIGEASNLQVTGFRAFKALVAGWPDEMNDCPSLE